MDHRHAAPSTETAEPRPRGSVRTGQSSLRATKYRQVERLSRQGDSGNWRVLLSFIPPGMHRQVPPGCVPVPPAGYSDGRHPTSVSRRRRRTPEAECSPIGLRGSYAGAGPPGGEREGLGGCSRMLVWGAPGAGAFVRKGPAAAEACVGEAAPGNLCSKNGG